MDYLKDEQHYIDRYDLHTIEECLHWYWSLRDSFTENRDKFGKFTDEEFNSDVEKSVGLTVNVIAGERYRHKKERLDEWMQRDRKVQEIYDNAVPPRGVVCKSCSGSLECISKDLFDAYSVNAYVKFMFECTACSKRQAHYENGVECVYIKPTCPKCGAVLDSKTTYKKDIMTSVDTCPDCPYTKKDVYDFKKSEQERLKKEAKNRELLTQCRKLFCWSDEVGQGYIRTADGVKRLVTEWKEEEKKTKNPIYQKARALKQLKVTQLKTLLDQTVAKQGYADLQFGKPEMGKFVIIDFTLNDTRDDRNKYDSTNTLKKCTQTVLENTNWRLMSDGIRYRLGILSGRLKVYEQEEDLVNIISS